MRNDTFYTNSIVRKKRGGYDVTSGHVTSWIIYRVPQSKYQSSVSGQLKEYYGGSKGERAIAYALLEVTSPEAALTENHHCSTTHLEQLRSHPKGNDPLSVL
jgi:hypothetical protein